MEVMFAPNTTYQNLKHSPEIFFFFFNSGTEIELVDSESAIPVVSSLWSLPLSLPTSSTRGFLVLKVLPDNRVT